MLGFQITRRTACWYTVKALEASASLHSCRTWPVLRRWVDIVQDAMQGLSSGSGNDLASANDALTQPMNDSKAAGFNVFRFFGFGGDLIPYLESSPGTSCFACIRQYDSLKASITLSPYGFLQVFLGWRLIRVLPGELCERLSLREHAAHEQQCLTAGNYDESVFQGIDYVLAQAARHNLKVYASWLAGCMLTKQSDVD